MSFLVISFKILIMIEDYPSYHPKKIWPYVRNVIHLYSEHSLISELTKFQKLL